MNVVVNGLMTNYQKVGSGKVIVCLHGWGDSGKTFAALAEELQDSYTLLIPDLPGFGGTQTPPEAWGLKDYANFVSNWLKKIGANKTYTIIGHSNGGAIAITGLGQNILKSDRLILLASAGRRNKRPVRKVLLQAVAKTGKVPTKLLPKTQAQRLRNKFYKSIGSELTLLPHMEETFKRVIGEDISSAAARLQILTLLIYGQKDHETPVDDGQILNKTISKSRLELIDAGHFLHQEKSAEVAQLIKAFLQK